MMLDTRTQSGTLTLGTGAEDSWWSPALLIAGVMFLAIFEGAVRKWVFPSTPALRYATYVSKDLLLFYAAYLGLRRASLFDMSWVYLYVVLIVVPSAGPTLVSSNPVGVFLSMRAYVLIPVCAYLAAGLVRDFRDIERCALVVAVAAIGVAALGAWQYRLPATHVLNRYAWGDEDYVVAEAGHVRATGTFAFISGMGMLAGVSAWAGALLAFPLPGRSWWVRAIGVACVGAGFVCFATSMSRGGALLWATTLVGSFLLYFRPKHILGFLLMLLVAAPFVLSREPGSVGDAPPQSDTLTHGLAYRFEHADTFTERAGYVLMNLRLGLENHPLGEGLGVGQAGSRYISGDQSRPYESEWGRIAQEVGPIGLAAILLLRFGTCRRCWRQYVRSPDDRVRLVMATSLPYFAMMSLEWMAFNHTGNSFAWSVMALGLAAAAGYGRQGLFSADSSSENPTALGAPWDGQPT